MAVRRRAQVWTRQPAGIARLDPAIVGASYQGFVAQPMRSVGGQALTSNSTAQVLTTVGIARRLNGSGALMAAPTVAGTTPWTLLVHGVFRASGASAITTTAEAPGDSTNDRAISVNGSDFLEGYIFDGGLKIATSASALVVGAPFVGAVVCDGVTLTAYLNGVPGTPVAVGSTGFTGYGTPELVMGYGGGSLNYTNSGVDLAYALKIDRALPPALIKRIAARPFSVLQKAPRRVGFAAGGGGAPTLAAAEALHAHTADSLALTTATTLAIAECTHGHTADALTLGTAATLAVADATHAHAADSATLTTAAALAVQDATHAHAADAPTLTTAAALAVADATHGHAADNITLSGSGVASLSIAEALHGHAADGLVLTTAATLALQDALHAHLADAATLTAGPALLIAEALHAHTADGLTFTVDAWLVAADARHVHRADAVLLTLPGGPTVAATVVRTARGDARSPIRGQARAALRGYRPL